MKMRIEFNLSRSWFNDFAALLIALGEQPLPTTKRAFLAAVRTELHNSGLMDSASWRDLVVYCDQPRFWLEAHNYVNELFPNGELDVGANKPTSA